MKQKIHIIGGGTVSHIRSHLALAAPAYGATARKLVEICNAYSGKYEVNVHLTRMANGGQGILDTPEDIGKLVTTFVEDPLTKIVFFNPAMVDYRGSVLVDGLPTESGKYASRLHSRKESPVIQLEPNVKVLSTIRKERKDIYLIGFKTTTGVSTDEQYLAGLHLLKESSSNLVLANDTKTRLNMIITPEEARYHVTNDRDEVLRNLVDIAYLRSDLHFTRSTVVPGDMVHWQSGQVPASVREVVDYCIAQGAYKPFRGVTAGHFAIRVDRNTFLTSRRKTDFNQMDKGGLVKVVTNGENEVIAYGGKPSVGGQSQRIVFGDHPQYNAIVHFHCPIREGSRVPYVSQRAYECGSHECGKNTSNGLRDFDGLAAVYLENHGPNIVFDAVKENARDVIQFIERNFDLRGKTGGSVSLGMY